MFEWLEKEISAVKTPRFHLVTGPAETTSEGVAVHSDLQLPECYREFILRFGNARLYHKANNNSYLIGVFADPKKGTSEDGNPIYDIGFHDGARVCMKPIPDRHEFAILEVELGVEEFVAKDFKEWLITSCTEARSSYGTEEWERILRGPEPFTPQEEDVIEARRRIRWRVLGVDRSGDHIFEITNCSSRLLPMLTVGLRSKNGRLNGEIRLNIGSIRPGQTAELRVGCYKGVMSPHEIEAFALPDPNPEDRARYGEFGSGETKAKYV